MEASSMFLFITGLTYKFPSIESFIPKVPPFCS